jgi:hypothetical protein
MSTRNLPGPKGRPARKADNLTAICEPIVWKMWQSRRLTTWWPSTACYRDSFTLPSHQISVRCVVILSTHLHPSLPSRLFPSGFRTWTLYAFLIYPVRATCCLHFVLHLLRDMFIVTICGKEYTFSDFSLCSNVQSLVSSPLPSNTVSLYNSLNVGNEVPLP